MGTPASQAMALVVSEVGPLLERAGFRKRRHTFNRSPEPGLVHVVNFQMGAYDPPGTPEIPGFRESRYGDFTINLGVFVAEMAMDDRELPNAWVHEYQCQLRRRIGDALEATHDVWWRLDAPSELGPVVQEALEIAGLPWLDRFPSRVAIVDAFRRDGAQAIGMGPNGPLLIAWLLRESEREEAEAIIRGYLAADHRDAHRLWLEPRLRLAGFGHLIDERAAGDRDS